jgi:LysM repeat protein
MRIRSRYLLLPALGVVVALAAGVTIPAQKTEPAATAQAVAPAAVPPEVQQKAKTYKGASIPPRNLKREADGHWTPYTPPAAPPEGAEVYTIQPGDTLSGLAQQKFGTWLLWPQIWDLNPYITDAHWIYPGDPLFLKRPQVIQEEVPLAKEETPSPGGEGQASGEPALQLEEEAPQPPVNEYDVYCSGYIVETFRRPHLAVVSGPNRSIESLAKGNIVYLNEGKAEGMENGQRFFVIQEGPKVVHPKTSKKLGRFIRRVAQVQVVAVQEHSSIAEIVQSCDAVHYGDSLVPYRPIPIPWDIQRSASLPLELPPSDKPAGRVVWTEDRLESLAQHNLVYVDLGSRERLLPGDKVWFFRYPASQGTLVTSWKDLYRQQSLDVGPRDVFRQPKRSKARHEEKEEAAAGTAEDAAARALPADSGDVDSLRLFVAEGVVLTTEPGTACVKVLSSATEVGIGDWVIQE